MTLPAMSMKTPHPAWPDAQPEPPACPPCHLIVMAKAPVAGQVKTRLIAALGAERAATLAERLLHWAVAQAEAAGVGPVELCAAPDASHPAFAGLLQRHPGLLLSVQSEGDIGKRMACALRRRLVDDEVTGVVGDVVGDVAVDAAGAQPTTAAVMLMGTDLPGLDARVLRRAAAALATHAAVLVPALDGGYGLIGLQRFDASLFTGLAWSGPLVLQQTRDRLASAGLRWAELPALPDIDEPADLHHLPAGWLP